MNKPGFPQIGKVSSAFFESRIYPRLGAARREVLAGPNHGLDTGIIRLVPGKVMAVTTDPVYIVPQYGWDEAAWFAWHILASDVTTCGFPPAYISVDWNLPLSIDEKSFEIIWERWDKESKKYGAAIVAGHTARYDGTDYPMVGGATFLAVGDEDKYLTPQMAQPGDVLIITKGPAVEAVGIFSSIFFEEIKGKMGLEIAVRGKELFFSMSTVEDALTAAKTGLRTVVTSMHDATECGILGGVVEVARASKTGVILELDKIDVPEAVEAVCKLYGMEPFSSISEGTLIITVKPEGVSQVMKALRRKRIAAFIGGEILPEKKGRWLLSKGKKSPLVHPEVDPFWEAFSKAVSR
ncbi:MAG: AIR synthase family protein [Acidobacteriota bacterium]